MEHDRDEEAERVLGDIIIAEADVMSYLNETDGLEGEVKKQATVIEQRRRKDMIMMAPVTECRCKKEALMTAPVTEQSPARYIY